MFDTEPKTLSGESHYARKSDLQIDTLAYAYHRGEIFGSWDVDKADSDLLGHIFSPLMLMDDLMRKTLMRDGVTHLYGRLSSKGGRSIKGYPMFYNFGTLDAQDSERLRIRINELEQEAEGEPM